MQDPAARASCSALALVMAFAVQAAAADGRSNDAPDPGYASAESAFQGVFISSGLGRRGYQENREYAAAIYQMPDGRWHATRVVAGNLTSGSIPYSAVPPEAVRVIGAHSHGQPRIPGDPTRLYGTDFSEADRRVAIHNFEVTRGRIGAQFLLTSRLEALQMVLSQGFDPDSGRIRVRTTVSPLAPSSGL